MEERKLIELKTTWSELLLKLENDLSKGMTTFIDEDLNEIARFLQDHRSLIPDEKFRLGMEVLDRCIKKIWTGEDMLLLKELPYEK